jgi:crotonobetainyl-CoA:carnitine CoA-transferase CaiB-like acyl-CoA transferase
MPDRRKMSLPLDGVVVVSLEQAVAAPFATRQLADLGARVIKIERRGSGDLARAYEDVVLGQSSYFVWLNRSKESLTLDLKSARAASVLWQLLSGADVLVQNLGPGAAARLGLSAEAVRGHHPHMIVCDISGYGSTGPWADRKAYDLLVQCETAMVSVTGAGTEVAKVGVSVADIAAGMYAFSGILTALYRRSRTGVGAHLEVSLFDALAEWMGQPGYYARHSGQEPARLGAQHASIAPYGPYVTADGDVLVMAVQTAAEWQAFCATFLDYPSLADDARFRRNPDRVDNRAALNEIIGMRFAEMPTAAAVELLDRAGVASARVSSVTEFLDHPVLSGRDRWRQVATPGGPISALLPPIMLDGAEARMASVPALGEHNRLILGQLGYASSDIERMEADGVI